VGVSNTAAISLTQVLVSVVLPEGLMAAGEQPPSDEDAAARRLSWAVGELGPGQSASASFEAQVQGKAIGDILTSQATLTAAVQLAGLAAAMAQTPGSPGLLRWDEASGQWQALASQVDWNRGVVEAELTPAGELAGQTAGGGQVIAVAAAAALSTGAQHLPTPSLPLRLRPRLPSLSEPHQKLTSTLLPSN
jgi:hypothetical protein